ncbi:DNA repair protein RecO [Candidatus Shapirobacteria bacterium CG09_land_8_20_14_0_10_38_17]|uniref:DNA repair protein RecO n=1 Tax=Candidatus Shapirobacteria bacterium CG09_land_8_20_14_0_10_38_17 TaxID=1974884 RepID=A0A2H0WRB7_9BACT|nr:MAG: DNA repair protein RecO [Candidatus Shapirobacteria bacterium CG09_land_8_20_14_0_10_38_17]
MHSYKIEGIVLGRRNFGEGDRVVTILSKERGKILLLAKGVRKISSRRGPHIEVFNLVRGQVFLGKTWDILGEITAIENFPSLRQSLSRISVAYEMSEIVNKFLPEGENNLAVFNLLKTKFRQLNNTKYLNLDNFLWSFKVHLLNLTGFWPKGKKISRYQVDQYIEAITQSKIKSKKIRI